MFGFVGSFVPASGYKGFLRIMTSSWSSAEKFSIGYLNYGSYPIIVITGSRL